MKKLIVGVIAVFMMAASFVAMSGGTAIGRRQLRLPGLPAD